MPIYNYTDIDDPSQVGFTTSAAGIDNSGQFVGLYHDAHGNHGFLSCCRRNILDTNTNTGRDLRWLAIASRRLTIRSAPVAVLPMASTMQAKSSAATMTAAGHKAFC